MKYILPVLGLPDMASDQMWIVLGIAVAAALLLAGIADALFGDDGFGVVVNAVLIMAGACVGLYVWRRLGLTLHYDPRLVLAGVASTGGLLGLIVCGGIRRFV